MANPRYNWGTDQSLPHEFGLELKDLDQIFAPLTRYDVFDTGNDRVQNEAANSISGEIVHNVLLASLKLTERSLQSGIDTAQFIVYCLSLPEYPQRSPTSMVYICDIGPLLPRARDGSITADDLSIKTAITTVLADVQYGLGADNSKGWQQKKVSSTLFNQKCIVVKKF